MPIHLDNRDVLPEVKGLDSVLIVACNMCAGASLAVKEGKPFLEFFRSLLTSPPLERHIRTIGAELEANHVKAKKFKAGIIQQFFLCLWTARQRTKFRECAAEHDAVIVMGCDSAVKTVSQAVEGTGCRVIRGTSVSGIMNTKTRFTWPCNISFEETRQASCCDRHCQKGRHKSLAEEKMQDPAGQAAMSNTEAAHCRAPGR